MRVKIKNERTENRIQVDLGGYFIQLTKLWRQLSPTEWKILFTTHKDVLDFDAPELGIMDENILIGVKKDLKDKVDKAVKDKEEDTEEETVEIKNPLVITKDEESEYRVMDKGALEGLAREKYGIELDKRKSQKNMIIDLKRYLKRG